MKTKIFFIHFLLFLFIIDNSFSQTNIAISEKGAWITHYAYTDGVTYYESWYLYKTRNDTIIKGLIYTKLYSAPLNRTGLSNYNQFGNLQYYIAFRNDSNNRAFIYSAPDTTERLWYDFNLSIGDTLPNSSWYSIVNNSPPPYHIVTGIDSIAMCGGIYYKRFVINNNTSNSSSSFPNIVQEVGFTGDLINENTDPFESWSDLICFSEDTTLFDCGIIISDIKNIEQQTNNINVYPNPAIDIVTFRLENNINNSIYSIEIRDILGNLLLSSSLLNNHANINLVNYPSGMYYYKIFNKVNNKYQFGKLIKI